MEIPAVPPASDRTLTLLIRERIFGVTATYYGAPDWGWKASIHLMTREEDAEFRWQEWVEWAYMPESDEVHSTPFKCIGAAVAVLAEVTEGEGVG